MLAMGVFLKYFLLDPRPFDRASDNREGKITLPLDIDQQTNNMYMPHNIIAKKISCPQTPGQLAAAHLARAIGEDNFPVPVSASRKYRGEGQPTRRPK